MIKEICIIGQPSLVGGADTELLDQFDCWKKMGLDIYVMPTQPVTELQKKLISVYQGKLLDVRMWNQCKDMHCISFCNGHYLDNLHFIKRWALTTTFVNCMTWNFPKEVECQAKGLIDFHLYQTEHGMKKVSLNLMHLKPYRPLLFTPYFDSKRFPYHSNRPNDLFRYGRISRDDTQKFNKDQLLIYREFTSPVEKSGLVLGWGTNVERKFIQDQKPSRFQTFKAGQVSQLDFYKFCDVMCSKNDTYENLPMVGKESMASGSVLVVDNKGGWILEVENGVTGFLCNDTAEFIRKMSFLACNPDKKEEMRSKAKEKIDKQWGFEEASKSWSLIFDKWEKMKK